MRAWLVKLLIVGLLQPVSAASNAQQAEFVWAEEDRNSSRILVSSHRNGAWQPGEKIVDDDNLNILPAVGMNSRNQKLVVWSAVSRAGSVLKYSVGDAERWTPAAVMNTGMTTNLAPVLVFDDNDIGWLFFSANSGDDDDIFLSRRIDGRWTPARRVNAENDVPDILAQAGLDDNGNVWVTWQQLKPKGYVELSQRFEPASGRRLSTATARQADRIRQIKAAADAGRSVGPPEFFRARSRATLYIHNSKTRPSVPVQGNRF